MRARHHVLAGLFLFVLFVTASGATRAAAAAPPPFADPPAGFASLVPDASVSNPSQIDVPATDPPLTP